MGIGDLLEREPTHICDANSKELIRKLMEQLERREKIKISSVVREEFMIEDIYLFTGQLRRAL